MRQVFCLNGEWDFMPIYEDPMCRELPDELVFEERKVRVPSSWRVSYPLADGKRFGRIAEYDYAPYDLHDYPVRWDEAESGVLGRSFAVPEAMDGQRIVLRMDGIMQKAVVYLNRERIAAWEDGYLPLRLDVSDRVRAGETHELHVVCGGFNRAELASGVSKLTGLMGSWYGRVARGIWQDVYLESYPTLALENIGIRTSVRESKLEAEVWVGSSGLLKDKEVATWGELSVRVKIRELGVLRQAEEEAGVTGNADKAENLKTVQDQRNVEPKREIGAGRDPEPGMEQDSGEGELHELTYLTAESGLEEAESQPAASLRLCENGAGGDVRQASFVLDWQDAKHWSPEEPFLYEAEFELLDGDVVMDSRKETFGFREFWCDGPIFRLNGIPINLRGDSWHFQGEIQQTEAYVRNWYRMCRSVGVNVIRLHAEPHPVDYLRIADEEGMLIADETAIYGSGGPMKADHPDYLSACLQHVKRLARRDRNHPSIVLWSVQNEMRWVDGRDAFKQHVPVLMEAIRILDPTRPIMAEGDNRLLSPEDTEVESRHYNIDGTIEQWDRRVPLTFGEHGGWWYICPQNSSAYIGLKAYRGTDESAEGLAIRERLFVEYARRQGVAAISTFNFAHYFMRAMPDVDIELSSEEAARALVATADGGDPLRDEEAQGTEKEGVPGVRPERIPAYSLTLNNGLLPEEYPAYRPNPAFAVMKEAFRPVAFISAEYNRFFYDNAWISRSFDVYNDTLASHGVHVEITVQQGGHLVHRQAFEFVQQPAERRVVQTTWMPLTAEAGESVKLTALLSHDGKAMHKLEQAYRIVSADVKNTPIDLDVSSVYWGSDKEYEQIRRLVPACERTEADLLPLLAAGTLLIAGSHLPDAGDQVEKELTAFVARGGRLLLLEQTEVAPDCLTLSRRQFSRAQGGDYRHAPLAGLGDQDLMFWHAEVGEEGPLPIIHAAYEKPTFGDVTFLLECGAGDFGDGGDLWSPLLECRSGSGLLLANQLELMANLEHVPQAGLLLRSLLAYAGRAEGGLAARAGAASAAAPGKQAEGLPRPAAALVQSGGEAAAFLRKLRLRVAAPEAATLPAGGPPVPAPSLAARDSAGSADESGRSGGAAFGLLVAEPAMLETPGTVEAVRRHAQAGGRVLVLPAQPGEQHALARLLGRPVRIEAHETYQLEADYTQAAVRGFSPVDLFGFDKPFLSPREAKNQPLAWHRLEVEGADVLCSSIEGTAWKDFFIHDHTAEHSRLALVELNRKAARSPGAFLIEVPLGKGRIFCSQLLMDSASDKSVRLYSRLFANLGTALENGLPDAVPLEAKWSIETIMALPCAPYVDYEAMKAHYVDPEFSLNNLGEGLYGWMKKRERRASDGMLTILAEREEPWFASVFVEVPEGEDQSVLRGTRAGRMNLRLHNVKSFELYVNGELVAKPEEELTLRPGLNRMIAIVRSEGGPFGIGMTLLHEDGMYMKDLIYRLTLDEVEPK